MRLFQGDILLFIIGVKTTHYNRDKNNAFYDPSELMRKLVFSLSYNFMNLVFLLMLHSPK